MRVTGQQAILRNVVHPANGMLHPIATPYFGEADKPAKPARKPSPFAQIPLTVRPLVSMLIYCYTHPKTLLGVFNTVYPVSIRKGHKGPLTDKYLPMFEPRKELPFTSADGTKLQGQWLPAHTKSDRTIVMGHGYFADWRSMLGLAEEFRKNNYNVFTFDFRAHGNSEGNKTTFGYNEGKDIGGAIDFVTRKYPARTRSLFYYGHSMGAASMLMAQRSLQKHPQTLEKLNQHVKGMVLDSPYSSFKDMIERFVNHIDSLEGESPLLKNLSKVAGVPIKKIFPAILDGIRKSGKAYTDIDVEIDEIKPAKLYVETQPPQKPILLLHGTGDRVIDIKHGQITYDTLKAHNTDTRYEEIAGMDHMSRSWDPAGDGSQFNTAFRNPEIATKAIQFFNAIKFGFSGGIKRLLPLQ